MHINQSEYAKSESGLGEKWREERRVFNENDIFSVWLITASDYNTIQYNIRLLEAVRTQRRTIIEREKYVENENVKMVHNE